MLQIAASTSMNQYIQKPVQINLKMQPALLSYQYAQQNQCRPTKQPKNAA